MTRKLVTVKNVEEVLPIEGADRIELIKLDGWQCVSGKGNFKPGDFAVYLEIDSFVPVEKEPFKFLEKHAINWNGKRGARIRTIKLRGHLSQGLVLPVKEVLSNMESYGYPPKIVWDDNLDLAEILGVEKWEPVIPAQLAGKVKGNFPYFIPKTDQERLQHLWGYIKNPLAGRADWTDPETGQIFKAKPKYDVLPEDEYEVSVKLDGASMTVYYKDGQFGVCSRNLELKDEEIDLKSEDFQKVRNSFWKAVKKYELEEKLKDFGYNIALQFELIGPGIQGNNENVKEIESRVFDIYLIDEQKYADHEYRKNLCLALDIPHVPILEIRKFDFDSIETALKYAEGSSLNPDSKREGVVFKNIRNPSFSFKIINNEYLLEYENR